MWLKYRVDYQMQTIGIKINLSSSFIIIGAHIKQAGIIQDVLQSFFEFDRLPKSYIMKPCTIKYIFKMKYDVFVECLNKFKREAEIEQVENLNGVFR